jgi:hypothetical protein
MSAFFVITKITGESKKTEYVFDDWIFDIIKRNITQYKMNKGLMFSVRNNEAKVHSIYQIY